MFHNSNAGSFRIVGLVFKMTINKSLPRQFLKTQIVIVKKGKRGSSKWETGSYWCIFTQNDSTENKSSLDPLTKCHVEVTQINAQDIKTHQRSSQFYTILKQILKEAQGIGSLQ